MLGKKIMVVEDEQIVSKDIQSRLKHFGYEVIGAADSGEEAIVMAGETLPDLVLMDVMLKGDMPGTDAAEIIRNRFNLPVVYLTAYADAATLDRAKVTEPYGYILKPFDERELQTVIEMALYKHRSELEKLRLQEQLLQSQKLEAVGHLTMGVAHNFNNALNVILGNLELARMSPGAPAETVLDRALTATMNAIRIVDGLLAFCREQKMQNEVFDMCGAVRQAADMFTQTVIGEIEVRVVLPESAHRVCGDTNQIQQVILNMCLNARDALEDAPRDGRAPRISLLVDRVIRDGKAYVRITVEDNGVGMSEDVQKHIFEPFFTTKSVDRGTGLGLATAYGIVQGHGGEIACQSRFGQGTSFSICLPACDPAQTDETLREDRLQEAPAEAFPPTAALETILLIEDEELVRNTECTLLEFKGYRVLEAANGELGWKIFLADHIDLILLDLSMPGISGRELLQRILKHDPNACVVIMTGNPPDSVVAPGARAVLGKPILPRVLFEKLREILDQNKDSAESSL